MTSSRPYEFSSERLLEDGLAEARGATKVFGEHRFQLQQNVPTESLWYERLLGERRRGLLVRQF